MDGLSEILEWIPFLIPIFILQFALMAVALVDVIRRDRVRGNNKVVWILVIVFLNLIGPVTYLLFGRVDTPAAELAALDTDEPPSVIVPVGRTGGGGTAVKAEGLSKRYGPVTALDGLNLEIPDNTVFGFLGPNGAGKTTTVRLLTGFARPTSGRAWVAGEPVEGGNLVLRARTGLLPDVPSFYGWMSGREFMHYAGRLHDLPWNETRRRTDELLELVELTGAGNRRISGYSRGMRQRLGIAQAMINRPRVLFMDEPTSALDPIGRREVLTLIRRLRETATVFMSTHILSDVERVCDLVAIIDRGRLLAVSSVESLQRRYARSVFEIEFMEDVAPFAATLTQVPWLADPEILTTNGTQTLRVRAVDLERARRDLPRLIGQSGLTLRRYELGLPSLEEVFMAVLDSGAPAA